MINLLLRTLGFYDNNGLKYSIDHLRGMANRIPFWDRRHQAEYVDKITKENIRQSWVTNQILDADMDRWFLQTDINTTAVGNIAFISLNHPLQAIRWKADLMLENYRKYKIVNK